MSRLLGVGFRSLCVRWRRVVAGGDRGNAMVEFVFVAVLVLVPLVYLMVAIAVLQRARLATTDAARDVGRAVATSSGPGQAQLRSAAALRIALSGAALRPDEVQLRYVAAGADCQRGTEITPMLAAHSVFAVCVIRHQGLPAVPSVLAGRAVTTVGRYVVHIDDFRQLG